MTEQSSQDRVLVVDDEPQVLASIARLFRQEGIEPLLADSGEQALELLNHHGVAVLLTDNLMPGTSGMELLTAAKDQFPDTVRLMMTGNANLTVALEAINEGEVYKFIVKPWDNDELVAMVREAYHRFQLIQAMRNADELTLRSLAQTIELKDRYTRGHCDRVAHYALQLAERLAMSAEGKKLLRHGCWLHDCGKIGIPESILNKEGPLNPGEFIMIKKHPGWGVKVAKEAGLDQVTKDIIYHHHERFDGSGYPDGLAADDIPLMAQIAAMADAYDALTTNRSYRQGFSHRKAMEIMMAERGRAFSPELLDLFLAEIKSPLDQGTDLPPGCQEQEKRTVLVVDDNKLILKAMGRALAPLDLSVITAESAPEALAVMTRQDIAVLITDKRMPGMGGLDLLHRVKAQWPATVAILMSGDVECPEAEQALKRGAIQRYLVKPWNPDELLRTITAALEQHQDNLVRCNL